jgi:hypothetical protein
VLTDIRALADHFLIALPNINSKFGWCNKVPYSIINESWLPLLFSIFSGHVFCLHLAVHKGKQETSVGEEHDDNKMRTNHKNCEIWKATTQGPRMTKWATNRTWT